MVVVHGKKCEVGKGRRDLREIRDLAEERGVALIEVRTEREGHCEELVRDADLDGVDAVGVMGGDGTFREGVCGMIARGGGGDSPGGGERRSVPIFAFPCGTGNNYARDLGQRTVVDVFDAIARGNAHAVDAVRVQHPNGMTYSINCVTWGMARDAAATAEHMRWLGAIRYDVAGFFHILKNKLNYANLAAHDDEVESSVTHVSDVEPTDYLMMFAQNTRCSGRGFPFTPLAKLDDGAFDLIAVKKCGVLKTVGLFEAVKKGGSHVRDPSVCYVKVKKATLEASDSADLVGIDGEVDVTTPINLEIAEGAFKTFV